MRRLIVLSGTVLLALTLSLTSFGATLESISPDAKVQFRSEAWFNSVDGDITVEQAGIGTTVDLEDDLGFDDETSSGFQLNFRPWRKTIFGVGYRKLDYTGSSTLSRDIDFGGTTYTIGVDVDSEMELAVYDIDFRHALIQVGNSELCWGVGVSIVDVDVSVEGDPGGGTVKESESALLPIPGLAIGGRLQPIDLLYFRAEARGVYAGSSGHVVDAEAAVGANLTRYFSVEAGYRIFDFGVDIDDVDASMTFDGFFFSGSAQF